MQKFKLHSFGQNEHLEALNKKYDTLTNCIEENQKLTEAEKKLEFEALAKSFQWPNGAQSALSLTYDDGLPSHINTVAPILKKYNFKATFYITMSSPSLYEEMSKWKSLAIEGHELGNHTNYHPCQKSVEGMEWVPDYYGAHFRRWKKL